MMRMPHEVINQVRRVFSHTQDLISIVPTNDFRVEFRAQNVFVMGQRYLGLTIEAYSNPVLLNYDPGVLVSIHI